MSRPNPNAQPTKRKSAATPSSSFHNGKTKSVNGKTKSVESANGKNALRVLDLFAGLGGLASGFRRAGFSVTGVDLVEATRTVFRLNRIGSALRHDLGDGLLIRRVPILVGGPPCKPWSQVNVTRRQGKHPDRQLLGCFFKHVLKIKPKIFLMENVPSVRSDGSYKFWTRKTAKDGYSLLARVIVYSDYGAPTSRKRLITVGVRKTTLRVDPEVFFRNLGQYRRKPVSVRKAIWWTRKLDHGAYDNHVWSNLKTIGKYRDLYRTNKYGWYKLRYSEPSPSFGNILKTYILHPEAGRDGFPERVLSVREALCIMGFKKTFKLPRDLGMTKKYQMIADAVSPVVSYACARAIRSLLANGGASRDLNGTK